MPKTPLSERLHDLALRVDSAHRIAETLSLGVPDSLLAFKLEDLARVHAVAAGISRLLDPVVDQIFDLNDHLTAERNPS